MKKRCVIVGGAPVENYARLKKELRSDDFVIYCDCGLKHETGLDRRPDLIVGDFDSHSRPETETETIVLPCEKDDTDTVFAVKEGMKRGFSDFLLMGVIGARLDHSLGNVAILGMLDKAGCRGRIMDDYSEMETVSASPAIVEDSFSYFSLLNISGEAAEIDITGAKYNLSGGEITCDYPYGISNEVLPGHRAQIKVGRGSLLLIKVY